MAPLILALTLFAAALASAPRAVAAEGEAAIYDPRHQLYLTKYVNYYQRIFPPGENGQPATVEDFDFTCPGDSVLVGFRSSLTSTERRRYRFACAFLANSKKHQLKKVNCLTPEKADNEPLRNARSQCTRDAFVHAFKLELDEQRPVFTSRCCNYKDWDENKYEKITQTCAKYDRVNAPKGTLDFACPQAYAIHEISSMRQQGHRVFSFTCCRLGGKK